MIDSFSGRWSFLSNFYPCKIEYQGIVYPSVEHYYVGMKIKGDQLIGGVFYTESDCRELISKIPTPGKVKRFGRTLTLRKDWDDVKLKVMEYGLNQKFSIEENKDLLLQTGNEELIEGNTWQDVFWGICNGKGENHLGKLLMKIRGQLKNSSKKGGIII